jgi:hypothetical protein
MKRGANTIPPKRKAAHRPRVHATNRGVTLCGVVVGEEWQDTEDKVTCAVCAEILVRDGGI